MQERKYFTYNDLHIAYKEAVLAKYGQIMGVTPICFIARRLAGDREEFRDKVMHYIAKDLYGTILGSIIYYYKRNYNPYIESAFPSIFHKLGIAAEHGMRRGYYPTSFCQRRIAILEKLSEKFPNTKIYY